MSAIRELSVIRLNVNQLFLAGLLYLLIVPFAYFGFVFVLGKLPIDIQSITDLGQLDILSIKLGFVSAILSQVINVVLAVVLFRVFYSYSPISSSLFLLFYVFSVPMVCLYAMNLYLPFVNVTSISQVVIDKRYVEICLAMAVFFWGLWLLPLCWAIKSSGLRSATLIALSLSFSGFGYILDSLSSLRIIIFPKVGEYTFLGELIFIGWLLLSIRWNKTN